MYQLHFFCTSATFSVPAAGLSSRSQLRGTQGPRVYNRRKFWPRPSSAACALGVPSESLDLASNHRTAFRPAEPSKAMETPKLSFFWLFALLLCTAAAVSVYK